MKDIKILLKEARELIKNKDYESALKICKNILKLDKENYMGLVFFGLSAQESGVSLDQALAAFKKATKLNPDNILAWNGLMNYYEKQENRKDQKENDGDIVDVHIKVLQLETNEKKVLEIFEKLLSHLEKNVSEIVVNTLFTAVNQETYSDDVRITMREQLANYFAKQNLAELNNSLSQKYEELLRMLVNDSKTTKANYYLDYFKVLYKNNNTVELFSASQKMYVTYQNTIALEWICKLYNESSIEDRTLPENMTESKIQEYCDVLINQDDSVSYMAKFTKAVILFNNNNILEPKNLLLDVIENRPGLLHAWYLLSKCNYELEIYSKALEAVNKADKLLKSINDSNTIMRVLVDALQSKVLSYQDDMELFNLAEEKTKFLLVDNENSADLLQNYTRIHLKKNDYSEANKLLNKLKNLNVDVLFLEIEMLMKQEKLREALDKLLSSHLIDSYDYFKLVGIIQWQLADYDKCLIPLLKAVKCKPYSYICFLYLGHYYKMFRNPDKSRRCYEKAFNINMDCIEAGIELTKIYRNDKNWEANLSLLESITTGKLNSTNEWAYFQLGLHYMEQDNYLKAIDSLRYIVRSHPKNSHFWETLGDAYFARGSYTSALKSYNQAVELSEDNLYSLLQIANIKLILQDFVEARKDFEEILSRNTKYLPALKGLADTCYKQGKIYQKNQLFGLSRDCVQCALDNATTALRERPDISCLWKIAADSCYLTTKLPDRYCCMIVSVVLADNKDVDGNKALERENLFELAARCYCRALTLVDDNILLWHDLGVCYLSHARFTEHEEVTTDLYEKAFACAKYCVGKNPQNATHWNLLGNISFFKEPKNYALAQHAFIKSIELEQNNAIAWCNLATLYLHLDKVQLANKAFSQAQRSDPNYVNSWIGQGLIAEIMGHEDAMDLFRHSTQLAVHPESAIGYGHWVCKTLVTNPSNKIIYAIHNMHAVTVAHDALSWYTGNNQDDACGWNIYGILSERLGLKATASMAFKKASLFCDNTNRDQAYINYGRILMKLNKYTESLNTYRNVKEANFNSGIGLALSLFKDQQYEESYDAYEAAYDWLTDQQVHQSDLLVALASMALLFQKHEDAKQLLLKSTLLKPPSPWALYATLSFALLYNDSNLATLVLKELAPFESDMNCLQHYATLLSHCYLLKGDKRKAFVELSKLIHKYPDQASVWYQLSILILRLRDVKRYPVAAKSAQVTMTLGRNTMDVTKVLCLVSLACYMANDRKNALIYAQKAIHCYPNIEETWTVFMCSLYSLGNNQACKKIANFIKHQMEPSNVLNDWLNDKC